MYVQPTHLSSEKDCPLQIMEGERFRHDRLHVRQAVHFPTRETPVIFLIWQPGIYPERKWCQAKNVRASFLWQSWPLVIYPEAVDIDIGKVLRSRPSQQIEQPTA